MTERDNRPCPSLAQVYFFFVFFSLCVWRSVISRLWSCIYYTTRIRRKLCRAWFHHMFFYLEKWKKSRRNWHIFATNPPELVTPESLPGERRSCWGLCVFLLKLRLVQYGNLIRHNLRPKGYWFFILLFFFPYVCVLFYFFFISSGKFQFARTTYRCIVKTTEYQFWLKT